MRHFSYAMAWKSRTWNFFYLNFNFFRCFYTVIKIPEVSLFCQDFPPFITVNDQKNLETSTWRWKTWYVCVTFMCVFVCVCVCVFLLYFGYTVINRIIFVKSNHLQAKFWLGIRNINAFFNTTRKKKRVVDDFYKVNWYRQKGRTQFDKNN